MKKKAAIELSVNFLVILIICIVIFGSSLYILRKFFTHADTLRNTYDERTEKQIEALLDDGSKVAIPFDKKTISNGEFKTFGFGVLNIINLQAENSFEISIKFNKAYDRDDTFICDDSGPCPPNGIDPDNWLTSSKVDGTSDGLTFTESIKNNEQKKFLLGVEPSGAKQGTYIFDLMVCYDDGDSLTSHPNCGGTLDSYDTLHKIYVEIP